jgi:hypothetical protein
VSATTGKKHWAIRLIRAVIVVEIAYLAVFNLALQMPVTQSLINSFKPDKFHVSWENAWTWYPFRAHAVGISANGQSRSQQWQVDAPAVSASISILPLILKRVWLSDIVVENIDYKQRPRLKADKDYAQFIPFFPDIEGREINQAVTTPKKKKRPWRLEINDIGLSGRHNYWIMQFQGTAEGKLSADLAFQTRGGPFSLTDSQLDLRLDTLYVSGDQEVFKTGVVKGEIGFAPFVPKDNKGTKLLDYLVADADINIDVNSLAFINLFTRNFKEMSVDGNGHVAGHINVELGQVLPGTDIAIDANKLLISILGHLIEGEGAASISSHPGSDKLLNLGVKYQGLEVIHIGDQSPLLTGDQLELEITGSSSLFPDPSELDERRKLSFIVESLSAPDLALFERYLPEKWPFDLYGGEGTLHGVASVSSNAIDIDISLSSAEAELGVKEYRFRTNLDAALKLVNASVSSSGTSIAGSYIKLSDAGLSQDSQQQVEPWNASLAIKSGSFSVLQEDLKQEESRLTDLLSVLGDSSGKQLLGSLEGSVEFESSISSLEWIGILVNEAYDTAVTGSGEINGVINLAQGMPAPGTDIEIVSETLGLEFLDYTSQGSGKIAMGVDAGELRPDWFLDITLSDADLKRRNEADAYIQNVDLNLAARIEDISLDKESNRLTLAFKIRSAQVTDMSIFNSYLPPESPFQVTNGSASLAADILLQSDDAEGWVKLDSNNVELTIDGQSVRSDLSARILLVGGVPAEMVFDISGSEMSLTNVRVTGENESFEQDDWSAKFTLVRGDTTWKKPLKLDAEATINILDSKPIVAMFKNQGRKPGWLLNMLTVKDIEGTAKVAIANEQIVISLAHAISDNIEVGAKGSISKQANDGVVYARYKKLDAVIKISDGEKNVDLIRAREKYDDYIAAGVVPGGE